MCALHSFHSGRGKVGSYLNTVIILKRWYHWPRVLRPRSTAVRLLRLWVRIPPAAWMSVMRVVCCQAEVSATR